MNKLVYRLFFVVLGGSILLAACGGNSVPPTATVQATSELSLAVTDTPTAMPLPTNTPVPTMTPLPTATPPPTLAPLAPTSTVVFPPVSAPPASAAVMVYSLSYQRLETCKGNIPAFKIINRGDVIIQSYSIEVYDATTGFSETNTSNDFEQRNGCKPFTVVYLLDHGDTGYIYSAPFTYDITGHKMHATITLCSHNWSEGGKCTISAPINFTP